MSSEQGVGLDVQRSEMEGSTLNDLKPTAEAVAKAQSVLAGCRLPNDARTTRAFEIFTQMLRRHEAMLQSLRNADLHCVFQQHRVIIKHLQQGIWLILCASDSQIADPSLEQTLARSPCRLTQEIDARYRTNAFSKS